MTTTRLTIGLWSTAALLDLAISFLGGGGIATIARVAVTYGGGSALALIANRLTAARELQSFSFVRVVMIAVPMGTLLFVIDVVGRAIAHGHLPWQAWPSDFFMRLRPHWAYFMMLFVFQSTVTWLSSMARELERHERRLVEARLETLRLQLNPHFLFNTLNTVAGLVAEARVPKAELMIDRLSDFLRTSLSVEPSPVIPLSAEIDMAQAYLDIEEARLGDRLVIRYNVEGGLAEALVPSLILQPLIENAVKYGMGSSAGSIVVSIGARATNGRLSLIVENSGTSLPGQPTPGTGIGQANVRARLQALYGAAANLDAGRQGACYIAAIHIPLTIAP